MRVLPSRRDLPRTAAAWRADAVAGVTVAVVALPLALAFGITTGLGADAGLVTAVVAGFVAALFGGSSVQVSGPTGAMTVVLVPIIAREGADAVFVVGLLAGGLLTAAAFAGVGRWLAYVPWPVIEGFTLGIAVIIFLQQVPAAVGVPKPDGENTVAVAARALGDAGGGAVDALLVLALAVALLVVLPRVHKAVPASLVAVLSATVLAEVVGLDVARIGSLPSSLPMPSLPDADLGAVRRLVSPALAVAALAALESLLSAKVADGMRGGRDRHDPDRELLGQGLANLASPLFGGMPATGAIARTAVNVRAGATSRVASMVHAVVLVVVVLLGSDLVARIPLAALAAVLMVTGVRMVERHNVRAVLRSTRSDAVVLAVTAVATVVFDLVVAVEVGLVVAAAFALRTVARTTTAHADVLDDHIVAYRLDGALFFGAAQRILDELSAVGDVRVVILRLPDLQVLDATGAQALGDIVTELESRGITVLIKGPRPEHLRVLEAVGAIGRLAHEHHLFTDLADALAHAERHVSGSAVDVAPPPGQPLAAGELGL